jgi:hypothetical protein
MSGSTMPSRSKRSYQGISQLTCLILSESAHLLYSGEDALRAFELSQAIVELSNTGSCISSNSVLNGDRKSDRLDETT